MFEVTEFDTNRNNGMGLGYISLYEIWNSNQYCYFTTKYHKEANIQFCRATLLYKPDA